MQFLGQIFAAGLACFAGVASAYHQPTGSGPVGNPFSAPGLNQVVPAGQEFIITWEPTTTGSVSLLLLKGPADNLKLVSPIAQGVPNTGNYYWTPSNSLAPGKTGYGIQLIDDATGQYQYTTQFGISNANYNPGGAMSSASSTGSAPTSSKASASTTSVAPVSTTAATTSASAETTTMVTVVYPTTNGTSSAPASHTSAVVSSYPTSSSANSSTSTPASSSPSASPTTAQTNGASGLATSLAGLVVAAGVAVLAI